MRSCLDLGSQFVSLNIEGSIVKVPFEYATIKNPGASKEAQKIDSDSKNTYSGDFTSATSTE